MVDARATMQLYLWNRGKLKVHPFPMSAPEHNNFLAFLKASTFTNDFMSLLTEVNLQVHI